MFQSPLDRGRDCDQSVHRHMMQLGLSFNPLSIGAVIVTRWPNPLTGYYDNVSIPSRSGP